MLKNLFSKLSGLPLVASLALGLTSLEAQPAEVFTGEQLNLATLNLAHGRGTKFNQLLTRKDQVQANLDRVGEVVRQEQVHVLALQEADQSSLWSGRFDHVERVASAAGLAHGRAGVHADSFMFSYGTALLSSIPLRDAVSHSFKPTPPTLTKGFVMGGVDWNPGGRLAEPLGITVVSLHLDFSRPSVRRAQVGELVEALSGNDQPLVLMGDFNSEGEGPDSLIHELCESLDLRRYEDGDITYPSRGGSRLDWILVSKQFEFAAHRTLLEELSDHRLVVASIKLPESADLAVLPGEGKEG